MAQDDEAVDERVKGLRAGGDDYLAKPYSLAELLARVEVIARRCPVVAEEAKLAVGNLDIDLLGRSATRGGNRIDLTNREFRILECLARNAGRVVTRSMLPHRLIRLWRLPLHSFGLPKQNYIGITTTLVD
ncbi:hypothetical protein ACFB49_16960 [Sphingomonas sp. DBB INV C78]|uniref:response regulator transcription factor n=1 Tax=Sphingomonas sp. DBB INV C78 TaxID=3349434 RepID=UPI0036D343B4